MIVVRPFPTSFFRSIVQGTKIESPDMYTDESYHALLLSPKAKRASVTSKFANEGQLTEILDVHKDGMEAQDSYLDVPQTLMLHKSASKGQIAPDVVPPPRPSSPSGGRFFIDHESTTEALGTNAASLERAPTFGIVQEPVTPGTTDFLKGKRRLHRSESAASNIAHTLGFRIEDPVERKRRRYESQTKPMLYAVAGVLLGMLGMKLLQGRAS